jgi:hypothetical protein
MIPIKKLNFHNKINLFHYCVGLGGWLGLGGWIGLMFIFGFNLSHQLLLPKFSFMVFESNQLIIINPIKIDKVA